MSAGEGHLELLSKQQREASTCDATYVAVQACAGSGKTETIGARVVDLMSKGADAHSIVAFTFTEKAAANLKQRIVLRVREHLGPERERDLGLLSVGTIHAYCLRFLQDVGGRADFEILDENREFALLSRRQWDIGVFDELKERFPKVNRSKALAIFRRSIGVVYDEMIDRRKLAARDPAISTMLERYEEILERRRLLTYGQIIESAVRLLEAGSKPLHPLRHLIVDEYQDINPAQERLIRALVQAGASLYVVGDAQQCIYQWRGSDIACFVDFRKRWKSARVLPLSENRRSRPPIIEAANRFGSAALPDYAPMAAHRTRSGPCVFYRRFETDGQEGEFIAETIRKYVAQGVPYRNIAVLLRSVRTSSRPILRALEAASIPAIVLGSSGLFLRSDTQAIGACFAWAAGTPFRIDPEEWEYEDLTDATLIALLRNSIRAPLRSPPLERLKSWRHDLLRRKGHTLIDAYQELLTLFSYSKLDPSNRLDAAAMANLGAFNELITDFESTRFRVSMSGQGTNLRRWKEEPDSRGRILEGLGWHMNLLGWDSYEERPPEDHRAVEAVSVSTVHQSKGLEWNVVFVPGLVDRRFPTVQRRSEWAVPEDLFDRARYDGTVKDEARAFYVAATRARDACFLSSFEGGAKLKRAKKESILLEPLKGVLPSPPATLPACELRKQEEPWVTFTPSELFVYQRCPHQYLMRQVWGYQPRLKEELGYGKAVHAMMREVGARAARAERVTPEQAEQIVETDFYMPFPSKPAFARMKASAAKVLRKYVERHGKDLARTQSVEARIEFPVKGAVIRGVADVILRDNNEEEVRDYKTSEDVAVDEISKLQVQLYAHGLKSVGRNVTKGSLVDLSTSDVQPVSVATSDLKKARDEASHLTESILKGEFPAKPSKKTCESCDVQRICRYAK